MKREEIETAVLKILMERFSVEQPRPEDTIESTGMDSLDLLEAILIFEQDFKVSIPDEKAENIRTVNDLIDFIEKALN
jgi:acyl carrier protein